MHFLFLTQKYLSSFLEIVRSLIHTLTSKKESNNLFFLTENWLSKVIHLCVCLFVCLFGFRANAGGRRKRKLIYEHTNEFNLLAKSECFSVKRVGKMSSSTAFDFRLATNLAGLSRIQVAPLATGRKKRNLARYICRLCVHAVKQVKF